MANIRDVNNLLCTGCSSCLNSCPVKAITIIQNKKGFYVPHIDNEKCNQCGLCTKKCPQLNSAEYNSKQKNVYCVAANDNIRKESSSGGAFTVLAEKVLQNNGYVCGVSFDEDYFSAKHIIINSQQDLHKLQKSKYFQSYVGNTFTEIKKILDSSKMVLFVGTPCQVAGLNLFLNKKYDNLILVDILCHGIPSQKIWEKYLKEVVNNSNATSVEFRDKNYNWSTESFIHIKTTQGKDFIENSKDNLFYKQFLENIGLNDACYNCKYACPERVSDITIGDFWGIKKYNKKLDDKKGLSLVITNTKKGHKFLKNCKNDFKLFKKVPIKYAIKGNPILKKPFNQHPMSKNFWNNFNSKNILQNIYDCCNYKYDGIITNLWSSKNNFGAVLSAYAIQEFFAQNGYHYSILNYRHFGEYSANFIDFINKYLNLTHEVKTEEDFKNLNFCTNNFIVGTDQVFRYEYTKTFLDKYLLAYTDFSKKRIAFSASFGTDKYDEAEKEKVEYIKRYFKRFDKISIREDSGVDICKELGVNAEHIIDPVFLIDKEKWDILAAKSSIDFQDKIVTYILDNSKEFKNKCTIISKKYNKEVINLYEGNYTPEDFISAIKNCSYFITDSFHGVCFSLIFHKKVLCLINKSRGASRFKSLINKFGINNIFIDDINLITDNEDIFPEYNNIQLENIFNEERHKAVDFLHNALDIDKKINEASLMNELDILNNSHFKLNFSSQEMKYKFPERIFSVKNIYSNGYKRKVITLLGLRIKIRKKEI